MFAAYKNTTILSLEETPEDAMRSAKMFYNGEGVKIAFITTNMAKRIIENEEKFGSHSMTIEVVNGELKEVIE